MGKPGKKYLEAKNGIQRDVKYSIEEAVEKTLESSFAKFDETIDVAVRLGVDPRHADQMVRGTCVLPHGTGKEVRVLVFAKGEKEIEAKEAGADYVGNDDLVEKIQGGWLEFDKAIATPDMMGTVGKMGRILGPRGLMPNAKTGTVTFDLAKAINDLKAGKIDFRVERAGILHAPMGKVSFGVEKVRENVMAFFETVQRLKPAAAKGAYFRSVALSTTMGPGVKIDPVMLKDLGK